MKRLECMDFSDDELEVVRDLAHAVADLDECLENVFRATWVTRVVVGYGSLWGPRSWGDQLAMLRNVAIYDPELQPPSR